MLAMDDRYFHSAFIYISFNMPFSVVLCHFRPILTKDFNFFLIPIIWENVTVARVLNFAVKFFLVYLVSMRESWGKNIKNWRFLRHHAKQCLSSSSKKVLLLLLFGFFYFLFRYQCMSTKLDHISTRMKPITTTPYLFVDQIRYIYL